MDDEDECKPGCLMPEGHIGSVDWPYCMDDEDVAEERFRARDYEGWSRL